MFSNLRFIFVIAGLFAGLTSCKTNCGPVGEPVLLLSVSSQNPVQITEIRPLNALLTAPAIVLPQSLTRVQASTYLEFSLPLNLNADQSRYVLVSTTRRDTITVNYRRVFSYEDVDCGYVINLVPQKENDFSPAAYARIVQTTVGKVTFVSIKPTVRYAFLSSTDTNTGINVSLTWP